MAMQGTLTDARVWLFILRGVLQTDGFPNPCEATDTLFGHFKERFPGAQSASHGGPSNESAAGPLAKTPQ